MIDKRGTDRRKREHRAKESTQIDKQTEAQTKDLQRDKKETHKKAFEAKKKKF